MPRRRGFSARLKLTLSYAGFLMVAGALLLAVVWMFLLRYVPQDAGVADGGPFFPGRGDLVRAFLPAAAWAMGFLLLLGLGGGWLLAGRMLAPLSRITAATRVAATGSLSHRIRMRGRKDEFRELADSFDGMLGRLEAQVAQQQRFAANASHELRTPLAVTQTMLEVARMDPSHDHAELVRRLQLVNVRAIELTEALLLLSRAEQGTFDRAPVDLSLVAEETMETLLPLAARHGVRLEVAGFEAVALGSRALLAQVAMNLVHNGIVHGGIGNGGVERGGVTRNEAARDAAARDGATRDEAVRQDVQRSPAPSGIVTIRTGRAADAAVLAVESAGETLDPRAVATWTEPFRRGAGRVRQDQAGAGLGLAIVQSIVHAHGGSLVLLPRREGGLLVEVRLPAVRTERSLRG